MSAQTKTTPVNVQVDPTNPGQFFACCGLLELADRLWRGAEGWFEHGLFFVRPLDPATAPRATLGELLSAIGNASLQPLDADDEYSSRIQLPPPFDLRLDWWKDERAGGNRLKVWAGTMGSFRIARAMQKALLRAEVSGEAILDEAMVVYDPLEPEKKVEPFYFDARRGASSRAIDVGFMPDPLGMTSAAYPAVEFLCLVGLQRYRPIPTKTTRVFEYCTWSIPLNARVAPAAVWGLLAHVGAHRFRFENAFRTDQRKHKAFNPAVQTIRTPR